MSDEQKRERSLEPDVIITEVETETKTDIQTQITNCKTMKEQQELLTELFLKAWDTVKDPNNNVTRVSMQCGIVFEEEDGDNSTYDDYEYDE